MAKKAEAASPREDTPITAENYLARAKAFCARGAVPFVVRSAEGTHGWRASRSATTAAQWAAWMKWFGEKMIQVDVAKHRGMMTVPAEYPEFFDPSAPLSDMSVGLPMFDDGAEDRMARMRERLHDLFVRVSDEMPRGARSNRPPLSRPVDVRGEGMAKVAAERRLDALRAEYRDNPPPRLAGAPPPREVSVDADSDQDDGIDW